MQRVRGVGCAESEAWDVQRVQGVGCAESLRRPRRGMCEESEATQNAQNTGSLAEENGDQVSIVEAGSETRGLRWRLGGSRKEGCCIRRDGGQA